ncbi:MAG TPA: CotH kinase family protein, partial [Planctomycetota bacterium]|nr:CotH kinase family protein [Planctomycetota bacterium]
ELYNRGTEPVSLTGWRFDKGINFDFPAGTTIAPDSYLVVARDPAHIAEVYKLPAAVVLGPRDEDALERYGVLRDGGERVTLLDERGNIASTVRYFDGGEWPQWADGGGSSMELIDPFQEIGEAHAWDSSDETQKSPVKEYSYNGTFFGGEGEFHLVLTSKGITMVDDLKMTSQVTTVEPLITYFDFGTTWRYAKGLTEASDPPDLWQKPEFDDSGWSQGPAIIGYGDGDEATTLEDMLGNYSTFYLRKAFDVADPSAIENLVLEVEYDDGYIAFLNGVEVASDNLRPGPEGRTFNALARLAKEKAKALVDLTEQKNLVVPGRNVLAVHVLNNTIRSNDVRWRAQFLSGRFVIAEGPNLFRDGDFESEGYRSSWTIQGTHVRSGRSTQSPLSGTGSLKIISTGGGDNKVNRIETSNTGLTAPALRVDYHISFLAKWIAGTPTLLTHGAYSGSLSPSYATSHRLELPPNPGTPGAVNSVTLRRVAATGSRNIGPVISGVRQTPALPAASQDVEVRARVRDSDGVSSVSLFWTLDTPKPAGDAALTEVVLEDPDKDGVYTGVIPGQAARKRVVFYIVARDTLGKEGRFPLDVLGRTNPMFNDPGAASVNDALYSVYRHDTPFNGRPHSYRFWMHQANESYMSSRPLHSNDVVDGSFVFGNRDIYYNSKVRFSGSPWARGGWGESYRVQMPKDRPLHESIERFNMEDHQGGGGRDGRERISHYLIRFNQGHAVVPYSLQWLVQFQVNDRVNEIREHVQTPNGEFIQRWFPDDDDGSFFEMDDRHTINDAGQRQESLDGRLLYPPYGPSTLGEDKEQYRYYFNTRGSSKENGDFSHLVSLAKLLTQSVTNNTDFDAAIWDHVDVEQWLRQWAIRLNTDDWDCWGARRGKNCYLYRPNGTGLWNIIPWDMELTYGDVGAFMPPALTATSNPTYGNTFAECARFFNRPPIKRMYYGILKEMVDHQFQSSFLIPYMQKLDSIQVQNTGVGKTNGYIDQRRTRLLGVLRGVTSPTIPFQVTTNGGNPLEVDSPSVSIEGRAPVDISTIVVMANGRQLEPPFTVAFGLTDVLGWVAEGNLPLGKNTLELIGLNGLDEIVESITFEVTYTLPVPPVIEGVTPSSLIEGELIAITGRNFKDGLKVWFGAVEAVDIALDPANSTRLAAVVPAGLPLGDVELTIQSPNGMTSAPFMVRIVAEKRRFLRGDVDQSGIIDLADVAQVLRHLFQGESEPRCLDAADVDDNGLVNLTDALFAAQFLFQGGAPPPPPHPELGTDPTEDSIDCAFGQE